MKSQDRKHFQTLGTQAGVALLGSESVLVPSVGGPAEAGPLCRASPLVTSRLHSPRPLRQRRREKASSSSRNRRIGGIGPPELPWTHYTLSHGGPSQSRIKGSCKTYSLCQGAFETFFFQEGPLPCLAALHGPHENCSSIG